MTRVQLAARLLLAGLQELGFDGTGIVVAILDTGVNDDVDQVNPGYPGHESLKGKFLGGGEFWCGQPQCPGRKRQNERQGRRHGLRRQRLP